MNTEKIDLLWTLTTKEKNIRTAWVICLLLQLFFSLLYSMVIVLISTETALIFPMLLIITISLFASYFFYHCAYKKHGMIWITLFLITTPFSFFKLAFFDLRQATNPLIIGTLLTCLLTQGCFYVLSIYVRKINKKIALKPLDNDEYKSAVVLIHAAHTSEDLDSRFYTSVKGKPRFFSKQLKKEYLAKKASFNS